MKKVAMEQVGCPYLDYDWSRQAEYCKLTDELTRGAVQCDFGYEEDCANYTKVSEGSREKKCPDTIL